MTYADFLARKTPQGSAAGFTPTFLPDSLFPFQRDLVDWAIQQGRAALFADCGLGKTLMQLVWAENVRRHTGQSVLILTPLAVGAQTVQEGQKFGIPCVRSRDGHRPDAPAILVTNYEQLHHFTPNGFAGVVCDESSILKHFTGATQKQVTRFLHTIPYRLLCTATAAPNDYIELGTASEALGVMGFTDMLTRFFRQTDNKPHRLQDVKDSRRGNHYAKLAFRVSQQIGQWRLKGHAVMPFWQWVCSWARACRMPSDLGYGNDGFVLPPLEERHHCIMARAPAPGRLFTVPAFGLTEEREERRRTLQERCQFVADIVAHQDSVIVWCHLNAEGDLLARLIPWARQVSGQDAPEIKEAAYRDFASGALRVLITKPKIGAWGLNWQHCHHVVTFASHSYEQYYQSIRRCWRYGQTHPVRVDIIATEGEQRVQENLQRKAQQADEMFTQLLAMMHRGQAIASAHDQTQPERIPTWLSPSNAFETDMRSTAATVSR